MRVGSKVFRDVEKMELPELNKVLAAIGMEFRRIGTTKVTMHNAATLQTQTQIASRQLTTIERFIKNKQPKEKETP